MDRWLEAGRRGRNENSPIMGDRPGTLRYQHRGLKPPTCMKFQIPSLLTGREWKVFAAEVIEEFFSCASRDAAFAHLRHAPGIFPTFSGLAISLTCKIRQGTTVARRSFIFFFTNLAIDTEEHRVLNVIWNI